MLIISAALYSEAKPFIEFYNLKKDLSYPSFQVFRKEDTALYITGTGPMEAAIITAAFLTREAPAAADLFLNIGICGSRRRDLPLGTPVLCNKLIEAETGRTYYPDVLYTHPFREGSIITSCRRQTALTDSAEGSLMEEGFSNETNSISENGFITSGATLPTEKVLPFADMEAAALYQAGRYFFQPHQMFFLKIISDYLIPAPPSLKEAIDVSRLVGDNVAVIAQWINGLLNKFSETTNDFTKEETAYIRQLSESLKLSVTMEHELTQYLRYCKLVKGDFLSFTSLLAKEMPLPVKSKLEGKKYLDYFKKNLL
ncbi:MAG: 5'-methylthioadenosine/S-adenosylhomocysteine nucleosidase family protein [Anaerocolumna jejuensis]